VVLKDLDLNVCFKLEEGWHTVLMRQVAADCGLLADCGIMDYSMLLGVHYRGREAASVDDRGGPNNFGEHTGEMGEWWGAVRSAAVFSRAWESLQLLACCRVLDGVIVIGPM
jgi:1-phosphatidylinositol-4-phosphate 5-kinase